MFPVELVVRWSRTHRTLALIISGIARLSNGSIYLGNVRSTSHSGLTLSKYPPENTRQVSVFDIRQHDRTGHNSHISFLFEFFSFRLPQLKIELDFNCLATSVGGGRKTFKVPTAIQTTRIL